MPKYTITETSTYEIDATDAAAALLAFLNGTTEQERGFVAVVDRQIQDEDGNDAVVESL